MAKLFEKEAKRLVAEKNVEEVRLSLVARMDKAGLEYLAEGRDEIFELFCETVEHFDGTEYMQGKKDGLRTALALLGNVGLLSLNRGGAMARSTMLAPDTASAVKAGGQS